MALVFVCCGIPQAHVFALLRVSLQTSSSRKLLRWKCVMVHHTTAKDLKELDEPKTRITTVQ
jgi:hypothetical protein